MVRDRQHGPVVELNRMQVRRARARPCATAAAAAAHKTVFAQMAAKMALLGAEALLLPHRVWKVKFVGEWGRVVVPNFGGSSRICKTLLRCLTL